MDSFFGIGTPELLIILILAGIVMGPERIAKFARWLGKSTAYLQNISRGFAMQLKQELDEIDDGGAVQEMMQEMRNLKDEVTTLRQQVNESAGTVLTETNKAASQGKEALQQSIRPPSLGADGDAPPKPDQANGALPAPPELPTVIDVEDDPA